MSLYKLLQGRIQQQKQRKILNLETRQCMKWDPYYLTRANKGVNVTFILRLVDSPLMGTATISSEQEAGRVPKGYFGRRN
jgi:hypothetical protein